MALVSHLRWLFFLMARLSQQALTDAIQAIQQAGGRDDRDLDLLEEALMATRNRVKAAPKADTLLEQQAGMIRCLQPLATWLDGETDLRDLDLETRSDLFWNLYASSIARTQGAEAFQLVTGNVENWTSVIREIPAQEVVEQQVQGTTQMINRQWHWRVLTVGLTFLALDSWIVSDRLRVYTTMLGVVLVGLGGLLWYFNSGDDTTVRTISSRRMTPSGGLSHSTSVPSRGGVEQRAPESTDVKEPQHISPPLGTPPIPTGALGEPSGNGAIPEAAQAFSIGARVRILNVAPYGGVGWTVWSCLGCGCGWSHAPA